MLVGVSQTAKYVVDHSHYFLCFIKSNLIDSILFDQFKISNHVNIKFLTFNFKILHL